MGLFGNLLRLPFLNLIIVGFIAWMAYNWVAGLAGQYIWIFYMTMILGGIVILLAELHERELLKPNEEGRLFKFLPPSFSEKIMSLIAKYSNLEQFEALMDGTQQTESIDIEAVAEAVNSKVIGQKEPVVEIATWINRRMQMVVRNKPIAVFLLAGPKGTGKSAMAKEFAAILKRGQIFQDMTNCATPEAANTLFGSPKGYAGSDTYGTLTAGLKANPKAVVILDEFEKAHPDVMKRFLTAWEDGFVTEVSTGEKISTSKAIFFLTTNAGADAFAERLKDVTDRDQINKATRDILKEAKYPPEVLSRITRIFTVNQLSGRDVGELGVVLIKRMVEESYGLKLAEGGIDGGLLWNLVQRSSALQDAGGVREVINQLEENIADHLIEARNRGAKVVSVGVDVEEMTREALLNLSVSDIRVEIVE
jgi:ATP-dependent Clp protease ATP-binding subunit ClpA